MPALIASALVPAAAHAGGSGGGVAYTPTPKLSAVRCVKQCAPRKRIQGGSSVRLTGRDLDGVTKVVFEGGPTRVDDETATVRARTARAVVVSVPMNAQSGPVTALAGGGVESDPTKPVRILPPPPPEPNVALSLAPGPRDAGAPALETATSTSRWFLGAQRNVVFSYRLGGDRPADVDVNLIRQADNAIVQTWTRLSVVPGQVIRVSWNGISSGQLQPEGRYAFRAVVHDGAVTASNAAADDASRDAFDLYSHYFPVRGRHDFGGSEARFGAGRSGHSHQGQDVMAPCGNKLVAAQGGIVKYAAYQSAAGYYLIVRGLDGTDNSYMHLAGPSPFEEGDRVYTGQQIGIVGNTGDASACHLHFEIWTAPGWYDGGKPVDPLPALQAWDRFS